MATRSYPRRRGCVRSKITRTAKDAKRALTRLLSRVDQQR